MKKLLALLLILALMLSLTPAAFADETPEEAAPIEEPIEEEPAAEEPAAEEPAAEEPAAEEPAAEEPAAEEPAAEPAGDTADPAEETGPETDAPAEDADAPAEGTDPAAPAGQNGEGDGEDAAGSKADDGPEYGVQPADEKPLPEEEKEGGKPESEEAEEEPGVTVVFCCEPRETTVVVFGSGGCVGTVTGGAILLAPGDYTYDASCDGYYPQEGVSFTVSAPGTAAKDARREQTVTIELCLLDEGGFFEDEDEPLALRTTPPKPLVVLPVEPDPDRRTPTVFRQEDSRWAASPYGYLNGNSPGTIAASGCGILALTNAVYSLNGFFVDPSFAADYAARAGFHVAGGTKWDFYRGFAQTYGTVYGVQYAGEVTSYAELKNMLLRGCVAICSVPGHIMAIVDYDDTLGRFLLLDSAPDDLRATGAGYVWISEQELCAMPSRVYDYDGLYPRFVLLRAVGVLDVNGLLDGEESDSLGDYGTFDVWIDGEKVANDQPDYRAVLPRGASYRIDDIRAKGAHRFYGVQAGALQGSISCGTAAEVVLGFGTRDYVTEPEPELPNAPPAGGSRPSVCAHWAGGVIGPALTLPLPKA